MIPPYAAAAKAERSETTQVGVASGENDRHVAAIGKALLHMEAVEIWERRVEHYGRRLGEDGAVRAVQIALQVDGPVKVVWTREEDIRHDMYRPYDVLNVVTLAAVIPRQASMRRNIAPPRVTR